VDWVDYGISDSGNPTLAYVRMCSADDAASAVGTLSERGLTLGGTAVRVELLRGEALSTYTAKITELKERTAHQRKAKRDQWWERKYGRGGNGGAPDEGAADADEAAETPVAASKRRGEECAGDVEGTTPKRQRVDEEAAAL
jgi:hypothetical protein